MEGKVREELPEDEEEFEDDDEEIEDDDEESFEEEESEPKKVRKKKVVETKPSAGDILNYTKEVETCVIDEKGNRILCNKDNQYMVQAKMLSLLLEQQSLLVKIAKIISKRFGKKNG